MRRDPFCRLSPLANGVNYLRNNASALLSYVYMMLSIARADILQLFEFIQYFQSHSVENFIKQRIKGSFVSRSSGRIIYVSSLCSRFLIETRWVVSRSITECAPRQVGTGLFCFRQDACYDGVSMDLATIHVSAVRAAGA